MPQTKVDPLKIYITVSGGVVQDVNVPADLDFCYVVIDKDEGDEDDNEELQAELDAKLASGLYK